MTHSFQGMLRGNFLTTSFATKLRDETKKIARCQEVPWQPEVFFSLGATELSSEAAKALASEKTSGIQGSQEADLNHSLLLV